MDFKKNVGKKLIYFEMLSHDQAVMCFKNGLCYKIESYEFELEITPLNYACDEKNPKALKTIKKIKKFIANYSVVNGRAWTDEELNMLAHGR